jgi:methyl-galactoside transport system substrate-binding protein
MKRTLISLFLATALISSMLSGCSLQTSNSNDSQLSGENGTGLASKKVGVCIYQFSDNFMTEFRNEMEEYFLEQGLTKDNIMIVDSLNNHKTQIEQINDFIKEGVDVLVVNPVNPASASEITDLAVNAGIPLVYVNREPDGDEEDRWVDNNYRVSYVGCDARQSGTFQGEIIAALGLETVDLNGDNALQYCMIEGDPENIDSQYRTEYSIKTLQDAGWNLKCVSDEVGNWHQETARQLMTKILENNSDVEVVFCNNDAMAFGALEAIEADGRKVGEDIFLVGVDALPEAIEYVESGRMTGTVFNDYIAQSHAAVDTAIHFINRERVDYYVGCHYVKVTSKNAQEISEKIKK